MLVYDFLNFTGGISVMYNIVELSEELFFLHSFGKAEEIRISAERFGQDVKFIPVCRKESVPLNGPLNSKFPRTEQGAVDMVCQQSFQPLYRALIFHNREDGPPGTNKIVSETSPSPEPYSFAPEIFQSVKGEHEACCLLEYPLGQMPRF